MNDMIFVTDIKHGTHKYITAIERGNPNKSSFSTQRGLPTHMGDITQRERRAAV